MSVKSIQLQICVFIYINLHVYVCIYIYLYVYTYMYVNILPILQMVPRYVAIIWNLIIFCFVAYITLLINFFFVSPGLFNYIVSLLIVETMLCFLDWLSQQMFVKFFWNWW